MRFGNPGLVSSTSARLAITNGHTQYIKDLTDAGLFDTGGDCYQSGSGCGTDEDFQGPGRDIDRSYGAWDECWEGGQRKAYASYVAAGVARCASGRLQIFNAGSCSCSTPQTCPATNALTPSFSYPESKNAYFCNRTVCIIGAHNCTTCTGKYNHHTRIGVSQIDGGPNDIYADPYNPWDFTVSMTFPSYTNSSSFGTFNYSLEVDAPAFCTLVKMNGTVNCTNIINGINNLFSQESVNSHGFSPSNYGSTNGRWDEVTTRGMHLHYPFENYGASFEPTRALVGATGDIHK